MKKILFIAILIIQSVYADNQTSDLSQVFVNAPLPFSIQITLTDIMIPGGIQTGAYGRYQSNYLFMAGRTSGLHGFGDPSTSFMPSQQNTSVFVMNPSTKIVTSRSLSDPLSGLTQQQIDTLSVTAPQYHQIGNTLYITGGYGIDTSTGTYSTKGILTAVDVSGLIRWVNNPEGSLRASQFIRQVSDPIFAVTGGYMYQVGENPMLLIFGQDFEGPYSATSGIYTQQVRRFRVVDDGVSLSFIREPATIPNPNYRRRDLNVVPIIDVGPDNKKRAAYVALSGVFTEDFGSWTVPVEISACGDTYMPDPNLPTTFKQSMNIYNCAGVELLSHCGDMYMLLFGGITFGYYLDGQFFVDPEFPFTNEVTVIRRTANGRCTRSGQYSQSLLPVQYPTIISTASNPGNTLLFGTGAKFMPAPDVPIYSNGVLCLEKIKTQTVIGYIIGGIQSTLPNTNVPSDSAASPYVFQVVLTPNC